MAGFVGPLIPMAVRTNLGGWVYTQRTGPQARSVGLQTLPCGSADPRVARLDTCSHWGCSQACGSTLTPKAWQAPCQVSECQGLGQPQCQVAATQSTSRRTWPAPLPGLIAKAPSFPILKGCASSQALGAYTNIFFKNYFLTTTIIIIIMIFVIVIFFVAISFYF